MNSKPSPKAKRSPRQQARDDWVILDVETTGIGDDAEIVQVGILSPAGEVLLDQFVKPANPIPDETTAIHGICDEDVADAPIFEDVVNLIDEALNIRLRNADFDRRMLQQEYARLDLPGHEAWVDQAPWHCAMLQYAAFWGDWNEYHGSFGWQKLVDACRQQGIGDENAHSAIGDCKATLALIRAMATANDTSTPDEGEQGANVNSAMPTTTRQLFLFDCLRPPLTAAVQLVGKHVPPTLVGG